MSRIKLIASISLIVLVITMMTSNHLLLYASPTTEDDGWVEGDDDSQGEISSQEELEEAYEGSQWEDDIGSNEFEEATNNDDDNDDNDTDDLPYCDEVDDDHNGSCFDRYDTDDITGLFPCKDGSQVSDPQLCASASEPLNELGGTAPCLYDTSLPQCAPVNGECQDGYGMNEDGRCFPKHSSCPDGYHGHEDDETGECIPNNIPCAQGYVMTVMTNGGDNCEQKHKQISCVDVPFYLTCDSKKKNDNKDKNNSGSSSSSSTTKTIVIDPSSATPTATTANAADVSNCKLDGSADGILQNFDTAKYQACKLHTNNDRIYYDSFVTGCMQVGNTKLICETVADSNVLDTGTLPTQTQTTTQPTEAIQPTTSGK